MLGCNRLKVDNIDVEAMTKKVQELLAQKQNLSPALYAIQDVLLLVMQLLVNLLTLNSAITVSHLRLALIVTATKSLKTLTTRPVTNPEVWATTLR